jgi:[amino group carrier protein]-L-2-aminoadipate 6-kinase
MLVVKVGGSAGIDLEEVCRDVAALVGEGKQVVLVHGGSHLTNEVATQLGHPPQFVTSTSGYVSRRTDRRTLEIFEMVYCGQVNKSIVECLQRLGINALGLSGIDGRLLEGPRKSALRVYQDGRPVVLRDDFTGRVERVNVALLRLLLGAGYVPVITPPAISFEGEAINVDGDRVAAAIATAMEADGLIILSNVPGLLARFPDETTLVSHIPAARIDDFMAHAEGRMKKKVMGAAEALAGGVPWVVFADGRVGAPIRGALARQGTLIA